MTIPADLMPDMESVPLADLIAEMEDGADDAPMTSRWLIDDDGAAEWSLRKLAEAEQALTEINERVEEWVLQIGTWAIAQRQPHQRTIEFFRHHLSDYARRRREADPEAKTLSLPSGTVSSRLVPARPVVVDLDAFTAWAATAFPSALRTKHEPVASELRKLACLEEKVVGPEGEVVPGVGVEPASVTYSIKAAR